MMFLDTAIESTNDQEQIGILSAKAAQDLGLTTGCPVHRSTSTI
jgi:ribulose kinase